MSQWYIDLRSVRGSSVVDTEGDKGRNRMDNVRINENRVMRDLGDDNDRTAY